MNYYMRHLGDYARDTRHLTLVEHGAYCLLLDYYYATEKPIPDDRCERIANAYAPEERAAVRAVLQQFFVQTENGWRHERVESTLAEAHAKSLKAREAAKSRWDRTQCERNANAMRTQCERNANPLLHYSITPLDKSTPLTPPPRRKARKQSDGVTLTDWLESVEGDAVPADDPIFGWAAKQGIPADWLALAWAAFEDRYTSRDKTYADWRAAFREHVRRGWLDVWRFDPRQGCFVLTTAGEQLRREVTA